MDCAVTTDAPVFRTLGGTVYRFPRTPWAKIKAIAAKLKEQRAAFIETAGKRRQLSAYELFRMEQELEYSGVPVTDVIRYVRTPEGIEEILDESIKAAGHNEDEAGKIRSYIGVMGRPDLALELLSAVTNLPPENETGKPKEVPPPPLA